MYYRISKNKKNLFSEKKIAQLWAVTLNLSFARRHTKFDLKIFGIKFVIEI